MNKRLTFRSEDGHVSLQDCPYSRQEISSAFFQTVFERLAEYEDLEENGQMIILPCPEGTECFHVVNNTSRCATCEKFNDHFGLDTACESLHGFDMNPELSEEPLCDKHFYEVQSFTPDATWIVNYMPTLGDTWFLTRDEAIKKLEEMNKEIGRDF